MIFVSSLAIYNLAIFIEKKKPFFIYIYIYMTAEHEPNHLKLEGTEIFVVFWNWGIRENFIYLFSPRVSGLTLTVELSHVFQAR